MKIIKPLTAALLLSPLSLTCCNSPKDGAATVQADPTPTVREATPTVWGQLYPKRRDDISYENEVVGFRIYGPGTQKAGEKAFGYDIFFKHPTSELILPQLYAPETDDAVWAKVDSLRAIDAALADDFIHSFSYHIDHGLGMDCYAVGPTLGAGVAAIADADSIYYPWCYDSAEILENGPDRFTVHLKFAPKTIAGSENVVENRIISLGKFSHLNHTKVWYEGLKGSHEIVAGFPLRDDTPPFADVSTGILAYSDPTQGPDNGRAMLGIILPGAEKAATRDGHTLLAKTLNEGDTLEYWWGFAWDRADITTWADWLTYLRNYLSAQ